MLTMPTPVIGDSVKVCVNADRQVIRGSTAAMRDAVHLDQAEWHADSAGKKEQNVQFAAFLSPLLRTCAPAPTTPSWE